MLVKFSYQPLFSIQTSVLFRSFFFKLQKLIVKLLTKNCKIATGNDHNRYKSNTSTKSLVYRVILPDSFFLY